MLCDNTHGFVQIQWRQIKNNKHTHTHTTKARICARLKLSTAYFGKLYTLVSFSKFFPSLRIGGPLGQNHQILLILFIYIYIYMYKQYIQVQNKKYKQYFFYKE